MLSSIDKKPATPSRDKVPGRDGDSRSELVTPEQNSLWQSLALRPGGIQAKLAVSKPGDLYEQEADRVADQVMRTATPASRHKKMSITSAASQITRKEQGHIDEPLETAPPIVEQTLNSPGQPLDPIIGPFMEERFGHGFGHVRLHTDGDASKAADAVEARAFTVGHDIAFAAGAFAPQTTDGRRLVAHELAHVVQQSSRSSAGQQRHVLRRAPALSGRKTTELVADSIAGDIDKAIAQSSIVAKFVPAKSLTKTSGNLSVDAADVYQSYYANYASKHGLDPKSTDYPGFTDREAGNIKLRARTANVEHALHEGIHLNSSKMFQINFAHACNEGVTQYFTEKVLAEQGIAGGRAYRDELKIAEGLISVLNEDQVGRAYFNGATDAYEKVVKTLAGGLPIWRPLMSSKEKEDWEKATKQLLAAFGKK